MINSLNLFYGLYCLNSYPPNKRENLTYTSSQTKTTPKQTHLNLTTTLSSPRSVNTSQTPTVAEKYRPNSMQIPKVQSPLALSAAASAATKQRELRGVTSEKKIWNGTMLDRIRGTRRHSAQPI